MTSGDVSHSTIAELRACRPSTRPGATHLPEALADSRTAEAARPLKSHMLIGYARVSKTDGSQSLDLRHPLRTVIDIDLPTSSRNELVVPVPVKLIGNQRERVHLRLGHLHAGRILTGVEFRVYPKPGLGSCVADAVDDGLVGRQRGCPASST